MLVPLNCATLSSCHPWLFMRGYASWKACDDCALNSCSKMMRPGDLGPVIHLVIEELISFMVVPPEVSDQSSVLDRDEHVC